MSSNENGGEAYSFHREGDALVFDKPAGEEAARRRREDEQHEFARAQVKTNNRIALFNKLLVIATFCTIGVGIWQGSISQEAARAARDAVGVARDTLTETETSSAAAAKDAKVLADKNAAQTDKTLQATIANFHLEQRAWVGVVQHFPPEGFDGSQTLPYLGVVATNSGRTPALETHTLTAGWPYKATERFIPKYGPINSKHPPATSVIQPNMPLRLKTNALSSRPFNSEEISDLKNGIRIYRVYGRITYKDIFGNGHTTKFCMFLEPDLKTLDYCDTYNEAD